MLIGKKFFNIVISVIIFLIVSNIWLFQTIVSSSAAALLLLTNTSLFLIIIFLLYKNDYLCLSKKYISKTIYRNKVLWLYIGFVFTAFLMNIYNNLPGNILQRSALILFVPIFIMPIIKRNIFIFFLVPVETSFSLFMLLSFFLAPVTDSQYRAILINANSSATFVIFVVIISCYGILTSHHWRIIHIIFCGLAIGYIILIESRASQAATLLLFILLLAHFLFNNKEALKTHLCEIVKMFGWMLLAAILVSFLQTNISPLIAKAIFDNSNSYYEMQITKENEAETTLNSADASKENNEKGTQYNSEEKDAIEQSEWFLTLDRFTSGRMTLGKAYMEEIGLLGHSNAIVVENQTRTAHNTYIQIAYTDGIISGFLLLTFNIAVGLIALKKYLKYKNLNSAMDLIIIFIYGMYSMVETMFDPLSTYIPLLFYITIVNLFHNTGERSKELNS